MRAQHRKVMQFNPVSNWNCVFLPKSHTDEPFAWTTITAQTKLDYAIGIYASDDEWPAHRTYLRIKNWSLFADHGSTNAVSNEENQMSRLAQAQNRKNETSGRLKNHLNRMHFQKLPKFASKHVQFSKVREVDQYNTWCHLLVANGK